MKISSTKIAALLTIAFIVLSIAPTFAFAETASQLSIAPISPQKWTGSPVVPVFTVTSGIQTLRSGIDYIFDITDNRNPGTATLNVKGVGEYTGTTTTTFKIGNQLSFRDVSSKTPHYKDIEWLAATGITTGFSDGTFRGSGTVIRQDMAAFLYRLAGSPEYEPLPIEKERFADVNSKTPHAKEIWWLGAAGITEGWSMPDGRRAFRPTAEVVRQDMAAFIHRTAQFMKCSKSGSETMSFADVNSSTPHYQDIEWLASNGVSQGYNEGSKYYFRGTVPVFRQDMAAFLHRTDALRE